MKLTSINPHFNACDQQWELMPEQSGGRRCGECERVLVDFTPLSEQEMLKRQRENDYKLCGRYTHAQVDRLHRHLTIEESKQRRPWLVSLVMGASSMLPLDLSAQDEVITLEPIEITEARQQHPVEIATVGRMHLPQLDTITVDIDTFEIPLAYTVPLPGAPGELRFPLIDSIKGLQTILIKGTVVDAESKETIIFANVIIEGTHCGTTTDFDGNFQLNVPMDNGKVELVVSTLGYKTDTININLVNAPKTQHVEVALKSDVHKLYMVGALVYYKPTFGQQLRSWSNPATWYRRIKQKLQNNF